MIDPLRSSMTPQQFIQKWQHNTLTERAGAQAHFLDLCELSGVDKPDNPDTYCFERGAKKPGAGRGWADVWKRSHFAWEYKSPGVKLESALKQLMMYALALDNPPLLVVSDRLIIQIHTHFTGHPSEVHTILIADMDQPANLQKLKWLFTDPEQFKPQLTRSAITIQAARLFGDLAWSMQQRGHDARAVAQFLNKMLFCLFAENIKSPHGEPLLPERLFSKVLANGQKDLPRFEKQLKNLFAAMCQPQGEFGLHLIEWFNGGLFDDATTLPLKREDINQLLGITTLDWSAIDPSIFGTLFERGLNPKKRAQLGAHYTGPVSIMRIVNPVIVEPLMAEWHSIKTQIAAHMGTVHALDKATKAAGKTKATNALKEANRLYYAWLERLEQFRILDPACGSGNFLYLGLQALKDIEHRAGLEAEELGLERNLIPHTGPHNVLGIELDEYAAELARITVWIGEIQWMTRHGYEPARNPILKTLDQIACRDGLLRINTAAEAAEAEWPSADAIIGNPPFLGGKKQVGELGDAYMLALRANFSERVPGLADLVTYWFEKARNQIVNNHASRAGLVATNSIRDGFGLQVLKRVASDCRIYEAWSDEAWINEGAAVRVSIVCFGRQSSSAAPRLNGVAIDSIGADLAFHTGAASVLNDFTAARRLTGNQHAAFQGTTRSGPFEVDGKLARNWITRPNPHGKSNLDVLAPWRNGTHLQKRAEDFWIIDFGVGMAIEDAMLYEAPFQYCKEHVRPTRSGNRNPRLVDLWWHYDGVRVGMRKEVASLDRFIATTVTSKHRTFVWLDVRTLPDATLCVIARADDVSFGILHSRFHECWSLRMCSWMGKGNDPRYTPTSCFDTFAFPDSFNPSETVGTSHYSPISPLKLPHNFPTLPTPQQAIALGIAQAAHDLNRLREAWLNPPEWVDTVPEIVPGYPARITPKPEFAKAIKERTLTNLYNQRPAWLAHAHEALDAAVASAYGWDDYTSALSDDEILARLLKLNLERAATQSNATRTN